MLPILTQLHVYLLLREQTRLASKDRLTNNIGWCLTYSSVSYSVIVNEIWIWELWTLVLKLEHVFFMPALPRAETLVSRTAAIHIRARNRWNSYSEPLRWMYNLVYTTNRWCTVRSGKVYELRRSPVVFGEVVWSVRCAARSSVFRRGLARSDRWGPMMYSDGFHVIDFILTSSELSSDSFLWGSAR